MHNLLHLSTARVSRVGWIPLVLGLACFTLVPARAVENASTENRDAPVPADSEPSDDDGVADRAKSSDAGETAADSRARETQKLSRTSRYLAKYARKVRAYDYFSTIGGLVKSRYWKKNLPLAEAQANSLTKLDNLLWDALLKSYRDDADYLDGNPVDYREYRDRSQTRRDSTLDHAGLMVVLGLLTEPQAAYVTQIKLSGGYQQIPNQLRYNEYVQELLGITESQKEKLAQVGEQGRKERARLNWFSVDPEEDKAFRAKVTAIAQETNTAVKKILTQRQHEILSRLAAERTLPAEPPNLPALSDAEAARVKLKELSPTFRTVAEKADALDLSDDQKKLLKDLEEVTRQGLWWISLGNREGPFPPGDARNDPADPVAQTRAEFLKHAEQVALLGILTERQAEQVQVAIKKK